MQAVKHLQALHTGTFMQITAKSTNLQGNVVNNDIQHPVHGSFRKVLITLIPGFDIVCLICSLFSN